jgi:hypothetical protein
VSGNSKGNGESYGYNTQTESRKTRNFAGKNPSYGRTNYVEVEARFLRGGTMSLVHLTLATRGGR